MVSRFRVQTRRAEYLLDAVRREEILGIFVAQNFRRIADADGARNVSFGICIGSSHVPNNGISRDGLGDIVAIDDGGGRSQGGLRPQERKRNEDQTFHDEPSVSSLLSSELSKTVYHLRVRVSSSNPNQFRTGRTADERSAEDLKRRFPPRRLAGMTPGAYWAPPKEYAETMESYRRARLRQAHFATSANSTSPVRDV